MTLLKVEGIEMVYSTPRHQQCFERPDSPIRHDRTPVRVKGNQPLSGCFLLLSIGFQQHLGVGCKPGGLMSRLSAGFIGQGIHGPYLPMGVRVGTPHHRPFVFEYLNPLMRSPQRGNLINPKRNHLLYLRLG
jgi:hypothetical protein